MPHGIFKGSISDEIGNILARSTVFNKDGSSYLSPSPLEIRGVFKRDKMIWPSAHKYKFWAKIEESQVAIDPGTQNRIVLQVKAGADAKTVGGLPGGPIDVDIFLRSCSWHALANGVVKYAVRVESLSSWCTIDDDSTTSKIVSPIDGKVENTKADAKFSLHIQPNYGSERRTTRIRMYQLKEDTDTSIALINGSVIYIDVMQEGDVMVSIADYSNAQLTLYTNSNYSTIYNKDNAKQFAAEAEDNVSELYFRISGSIHMQSGLQNKIWFGQNGESLTSSSITFTDSSSIASMYDVSCANGYCSAKVKWNTNMPSASVMKEVMRDFAVTPSSFSHFGGYCEVSFYLMKIGTSVERSTQFTISIPNSDQWIGSCKLTGPECVIWQKGDTVTVPVTDANPTIDVNEDTKKYVTEYADSSVKVNGLYGKTFLLAKQTPVVYSHIEDVQLYIIDQLAYQESVPYIGGDIRLRFKIYTNDSTYLERSFVVTAKHNDLVQTKTVVQEASADSEDVEVTASNYPNVASNLLISNIIADPYVVFLSDFSKPRYLSSKWQVTATAAPNLCHKLDKMIVVSPIYDTVSSDSHNASNKFGIDVTVQGGEVNSEMRYDGVKIVCDSIKLDDQIDVSQSASGDAQATTYFDTLGVVIENTTDKLSCTVDKADTSTHIYHGWLVCKENNDKVPGTATTIPYEVTSWSLGTVANDLTSVVFIQVKGYPGAKGQERKIEIKVSVKDNSCNPVITSAIQEGKDLVIDYNSASWVSDLDLSAFTMREWSQATLLQLQTPIYMSEGWYCVPVKIDDNTSATSVSFSFYIGNQDMREEKYVYTIPEYNTNNILTPISGSWTQRGEYVTRTATLSVKNIKDLDLEWTQVPYNGNKSVNSIPGKDYELKIEDDIDENGNDWLDLDMSETHLVAAKNMTTKKRTATVSIRYKNGSTLLSDWISASVTQDCMLSSDELGYKLVASPTEVIIDEVEGTLTQPFSLIDSIDYEGTIQRITTSCYPADLDCGWSTTSTGQYKMLFTSKVKLRTGPKEWTVTVSQRDNSQNAVLTGKTVNIKVKQPSYQFLASIDGKDGVTMSSGDTKSLIVRSLKTWPDGTTEEVPFTIAQSEYGWLSVSENSVAGNYHTYNCNVFYINKGDTNRSVKLTLKQSSTNEIITITVTEPNWRESNFNESAIDIYYDKIDANAWMCKKQFWSVINQKNSSVADIRVRWDSGTTPSWVTCKIVEPTNKNNGNLCAEFTTTGILEGTVPLTDVVKIDNGMYGIGSCRVTKHAFIFNVGFEKDAEGTNVIYVSATATKVWSMYYVDSRMDNWQCEYTCTSDDRKCTIKVSGNALEVFANYSNTSNTRKVYSATIQQKYSLQKKKIAIIQLTKEEEAEYDFDY